MPRHQMVQRPRGRVGIAARARSLATWWLAGMLCAALPAIHTAAAEPFWYNAVKVVAPDRMTVTTSVGSGQMPLYLSADWTHPMPGIRRAIIVMHGISRTADVAMRAAIEARAAAGPEGEQSLMIAPQFLVPIDVTTFNLPANTLRWSVDGWPGGEPALGPAPLSSFDVFDAILRRLADRSNFPDLKEIVVAGHSAGGQIVQRYAVAAHNDPALAAAGIRVRYVIANLSSYLYFSPDRPEPVTEASCPNYNRWKYGLAGAPPYVGPTAGLEARYAGRNVTYLLGTADKDPNHIALDKSCAAEAQGPYRLARGNSYFAYITARHPSGLDQRLLFVPGVAHNEIKMFDSTCGLAALFGLPGCPGS